MNEKKSHNNKSYKDIERIRILYSAHRNYVVEPLWEIVWQSLKWVNIELLYDPAIHSY